MIEKTYGPDDMAIAYADAVAANPNADVEHLKRLARQAIATGKMPKDE